ncbi:hypothetical protein GP475_00835 [Corynebacterium poyangense]|uniref:Uncharacterized protein n=1 Tax=Corynebacterium poyangense TaxID=2684405 RepID=A0A7H0SLB4_9CORY|nr:hypothetical protein [Corynebacterium poyangense]QNQ89339.1 hypothetical protein GP475_00835 [Corynebacterium poyangense]
MGIGAEIELSSEHKNPGWQIDCGGHSPLPERRALEGRKAGGSRVLSIRHPGGGEIVAGICLGVIWESRTALQWSGRGSGRTLIEVFR